MLTICHVVALHESTDRVLATVTRQGWVLPTLVSPDLAASGALLARAIAALPLPAAPRCQANLQIDRASGSANVLLIVDITSSGAEDNRLVPIATLRDTAPVVSYQANALQVLHPRAATSRSAFLERDWIRAVTDWVASVTGEDPTELRRHAAVHRAEVERAVVAFDARGRRWHFKGELRRPFVEAFATRHIAAHLPGAVAPTLCFDEARGWWLTSDVHGVPLDGRCWPAHLSAAATWGGLQRKLRPSHDALCALGVPQLHPQDLVTAATDALHTATPDLTASAQQTLAERVSALLDAPIVRDGPAGVLHFDAAPRNILWNGHAAVFLDLETLCIGPAAIAGELMMRRMRTDLSPEQQVALARTGASTALRLAGAEALEHALWRLPALTDLCLLAVRRRWLHEAAASDAADPSAGYTWRHVSRDFVARASSWPSSPGESAFAP